MTKFLLLPLLTASAFASKTYCPVASDMAIDYGDNIDFSESGTGWTITGKGRVSSLASWNLLGGSMSFTMDVSQVADSINTNFYTSSPAWPNTGVETYCDAQLTPGCMELDVVEANGKCAMQTTVHTFEVDGAYDDSNCNRFGCQSSMHLASTRFRIEASWDQAGIMTVLVDGVHNDDLFPFPSDASNDVVVETMKSVGAVIESSQWYGWVPLENECPTAGEEGLDASVFKISDVVVVGELVQGPEPAECAVLATSSLRGAVQQ
jgi:hypothetical protein